MTTRETMKNYAKSIFHRTCKTTNAVLESKFAEMSLVALVATIDLGTVPLAINEYMHGSLGPYAASIGAIAVFDNYAAISIIRGRLKIRRYRKALENVFD